ncbi:tetratricopeptide (TPR) repeat protein [Croceifilum oryzae]|uniref:Tetratricopeptide (TPR) repeat protein n=1 Tax=Croceifilum oryzae TaxID=1553429 RepID=A0AAJ1THB7_9BACL|nr:hypothetical protein [Croceifilum oryzae]MDQ0418940.1 tetratricopeptide (TPR) repeat protein [Croceifilum oryzae]
MQLMILDDRRTLGDLLRNRMNELGIRQKDLMDERLTTTTISNIITGKKNVSKKTISYLCQKLDWELEQIPQYLENLEQIKIDQSKQIRLQLKAIETDVGSKQALEKIKEIISSDDPYILATIEYLKGKCYARKGKWERARDHYFYSIRFYDAHPEIRNSNLKSASFNELARVYYNQNQYEEALKCARKGKECFIQNGERKYFQFHLQISEAIYLDNLGLPVEALKVLEKMWKYQSEIETETLLNMYSLQSILYNKLKLYDEAVKNIEVAIEIARLGKHYDHIFELWTTLGVSYKNLGNIHFAKICFDTASQLQDKVRSKHLLLAYNYTESGKMYLSERDTKRASEVLTNAVKLSKKANDGTRQLEAQTALGECYLLQDRFLEAVQQFHEAYGLANKLSFLEQECNLTLKLALCYEGRDIVKYNRYYALFYQRSVQLLSGGEPIMLQVSKSFPQPEREIQPEPPEG